MTISPLTKKNIEVFLLDGLIILGSFFLSKINVWQMLDKPVINSADIEAYQKGGSSYIWLFLLVTIITLVYAMARKSTPKNPVLYTFYGLGLFGMMWLCAGILALAFNSVIMALPGLFIGYIVALKHQAGDTGLMKYANGIYDHTSRALILPLIAYLFISGSEYVLKTRISITYSLICIVMIYIPIRLMLAFKEPYKFYHFIIMIIAFGSYTNETFTELLNSPAAPVWRSFSGYLGDSVTVSKETDREAVLYVREGGSSGKFVVVSRDEKGKWAIDPEKTKLYKY